MMPGPYTTITVDEYNRIAATIKVLRLRIQKAREALERKEPDMALLLLKIDSDE
jgi:hypothetical protein